MSWEAGHQLSDRGQPLVRGFYTTALPELDARQA